MEETIAPAVDEAREIALKKAAKLEKKAAKLRAEAGIEEPVASVTKSAAPVVQTMDVEAILAKVREEFSGQLEVVTKALKDEQARTDALQKSLDTLADQPDPNVVAFRGIASEPSAIKSSTPSVMAPSVAETAERQQAALMRALHEQARNSPNPSEREAAWAKLYQMNGLA